VLSAGYWIAIVFTVKNRLAVKNHCGKVLLPFFPFFFPFLIVEKVHWGFEKGAHIRLCGCVTVCDRAL
jgi:hypothetical protein